MKKMPGRVVVQKVILRVDGALGALGQPQAYRQRLGAIVQQVEAAAPVMGDAQRLDPAGQPGAAGVGGREGRILADGIEIGRAAAKERRNRQQGDQGKANSESAVARHGLSPIGSADLRR
ncbi:hypothetical protein ACFOHS_01555 [Jhaorihella thermophila]